MQKPSVVVSMQWNVGQVVQSPYWPMKPGQSGGVPSSTASAGPASAGWDDSGGEEAEQADEAAARPADHDVTRRARRTRRSASMRLRVAGDDGRAVAPLGDVATVLVLAGTVALTLALYDVVARGHAWRRVSGGA
jgi:hypothetical protein